MIIVIASKSVSKAILNKYNANHYVNAHLIFIAYIIGEMH